jgi:hypothetical protein
MNQFISTIIKIIFLIIILVIIYYYIDNYEKKIKKEDLTCELDKLDIDDLVIINRNPEYSKLINKLIDEKSFIFTDEQLKVLKNPNQFYDTKNNNVENISEMFYRNCKYDIDTPVGKNVEYFENSTDNQITIDDPLEITSSKEYDKIVSKFEKNIANTIKPDCVNSCVLSDPKYLQDYYLDVYGNKVKASLTDYFADYYTTINIKEPKECIPVETLIGKSNFIIPDQFSIQKYLTNAYNVDWSRVVNPYTIY